MKKIILAESLAVSPTVAAFHTSTPSPLLRSGKSAARTGLKSTPPQWAGMRFGVTGCCSLLLACSAIGQDGQSEAQAKQDHDRALVVARQAMNAGDYDKAVELADLVLQGWPKDPVATDILTKASMRKAMLGAEPARITPSPTPAAAPVVTAPAPAASAPAPDSEPKSTAADSSAVAPVAFQAPKPTKHQVSISGDYFLGQGDVTLPIGFSLADSGLAPAGYKPSVVEPTRDASYFGGTLSYSYGQRWYVDVGYLQGNSSGQVNADLGGGLTPPSNFTIDETGYQAYLRYVPASQRGKRLSYYYRLGVAYVDSKMTDQLVDPLLGFYQEEIEATDLLGNLGVGLGYRLYSAGRFRLGLQLEVEGFGGIRQQDITESFPNASDGGLVLPTTTIDNLIYGGAGRGTVRMEYSFGESGLWRVFVEGGVKVIYTRIDYPSAQGFDQQTFDELLWGPYAKLGISYSF